jgi:hypothetical protein
MQDRLRKDHRLKLLKDVEIEKASPETIPHLMCRLLNEHVRWPAQWLTFAFARMPFDRVRSTRRVRQKEPNSETASRPAGLNFGEPRGTRTTHDHERSGPTMLQAALDVKTGPVTRVCDLRLGGKELIRLLKRIDPSANKYVDIQNVLNNSGAHKAGGVKAWLSKHPHMHLHFTPTSASWLARIFGETTTNPIRCRTLPSAAELEDAKTDFSTDTPLIPNLHVGERAPLKAIKVERYYCGLPASWVPGRQVSTRCSTLTRSN